MKFANFLYFCITHRKLIPISRKRYQFFLRNTKQYKICKLHRAGIYLSHFTTFHNQTFQFYQLFFDAVAMDFTISNFSKFCPLRNRSIGEAGMPEPLVHECIALRIHKLLNAVRVQGMDAQAD